MHVTRHNGLAGKARRARDLGRAHRLYAQQVLDEFFDEDEQHPFERFIPVRNHYEFLPSAGVDIVEPEPALGSQLEFSLAAEHADLDRVRPSLAAFRQEPDVQVAADVAVAPPVLPQPKAIPPVRPRVTFTPVDHCRRRRQKLTPGGFILGCAVGSAAAAIVLLVLQIAVG